MLVSGVQQILFHYRLLQDTEYSSLFYMVGPCCFIYFIYSRCVSVNLELLIYPHPAPTFSFGSRKFVFYVFESVSVSQISSFVSFFKTPHISDIIWYLSFSVWLTSLSMIISRSIPVAASGIISFFLWLSNIPLCICTTSSLSNHLSVDT